MVHLLPLQSYVDSMPACIHGPLTKALHACIVTILPTAWLSIINCGYYSMMAPFVHALLAATIRGAATI